MLYEFNSSTGEFSMEIPSDSEKTENRTEKKPPELEELEVAVFNKETQEWEVYKDYRFKYMKKDEKGDITPIENFGDIEEGYTLIDFEEGQKTLHNNNLHITKLDFFNKLCVPANITYDVLMAKIDELGMRATWEFCNHVYYGVVKPFLSALPLGKTEEEIIAIFEDLQNNDAIETETKEEN